MRTMLEAILMRKYEEIGILCREFGGSSLAFEPVTRKHRFRDALCADDRIGVIAEVKRASPSAGIIRQDLDPVQLANSYVRGGASAISVLTDQRFFGGSRRDLELIREMTNSPVLRKDFIIDELQVLESRQMAADAILLILSILSQEKAEKLMYLADSLDMDCLVETHTLEEFKRAIDLGARLIGINNRDLRTFKTDLYTTVRILEKTEVHDGVLVVSESGISNKDQVKMLADAGVDAVLVGEALVRANCPMELVSQMRSVRAVRRKSCTWVDFESQIEIAAGNQKG